MTPEEIKQLAERIDVRRGKVPSWRDWLAARDVIELQQQEIAELRAEQRRHVEELRRDVLGETHEKLVQAQAEIKRISDAYHQTEYQVCQIIGKATGMPWYKDHQKNFPGSTEVDGVCTGELIAEDMANMAVQTIKKQQQEIADLYATAAHDNELVGKYMADAERLEKENMLLKQEISDLRWLRQNDQGSHVEF